MEDGTPTPDDAPPPNEPEEPKRGAKALLDPETGRFKVSRLNQAVVISLFTQAAGLGLGFVSHVALSRTLDVGNYGIYAYVLSWVAVLALFAKGGSPLALVRFISEYRVQKAWGHIRGLVHRLVSRTLLIGLVIVLLLFPLILLLPFGPLTTDRPAFLVGALLIPLTASVNLFMMVLRSFGRVSMSYMPMQIVRPSIIIAGVGAWYLLQGPLDPVQALLVTAGSMAAVQLVQIIVFRKALPREVQTAQPVYEDAKWNATSGVLLIDAMFGMLMTQLSVLVVGTMLGPRETGLYSAAAQSARLVPIVLVAINMVAAPVYPRLLAQGKKDKAQMISSQMAHWSFWPSLLVYVGFILLGSQLLGLFGPRFVGSYEVLLVLALAQLLNVATGTSGVLLRVTGYQKASLVMTAASVVLLFVLSVIGVYFWGLIGAAVATAIGTTLQHIAMNRYAVRVLGINSSIVHALLRPFRRRPRSDEV